MIELNDDPYLHKDVLYVSVHYVLSLIISKTSEWFDRGNLAGLVVYYISRSKLFRIISSFLRFVSFRARRLYSPSGCAPPTPRSRLSLQTMRGANQKSL